jgi:hypothetical protein
MAENYAKGRRRFRRLVMLGLLLSAFAVLMNAWLFRLDAERADQVRALANDNRALSCAMARLVAYVPAVQFEGDSRENFLGWLRSRREMLSAVSEGGRCSESTVRLLAERVRLDDEALAELERP